VVNFVGVGSVKSEANICPVTKDESENVVEASAIRSNPVMYVAAAGLTPICSAL
jgi:hypothetical protein